MTVFSWLQLGLYILILLLLVKPLGSFMARVYQGERTFLTPFLQPAADAVSGLCSLGETGAAPSHRCISTIHHNGRSGHE
jgi:K+-transporting ATPase A subunit